MVYGTQVPHIVPSLAQILITLLHVVSHYTLIHSKWQSSGQPASLYEALPYSKILLKYVGRGISAEHTKRKTT